MVVVVPPVPLPQLCEPALAADPPSAAHSRPRRAVDYLLNGSSIMQNRHLARFKAAPYLQQLLDAPEFSPMLSRQSKQLKKELIEAYAIVEVLQRQLASDEASAPVAAIVDLCSGKGFMSAILALEFPSTRVIMVDIDQRIKTGHVGALPNLRFVRADIMSSAFAAQLTAALAAAVDDRISGGRGSSGSSSSSGGGGGSGELGDCQEGAATVRSGRGRCIAVGMHLCGSLAPRAIELFGGCVQLDALVLVPCCLDKRTDTLLKAQAKLRGVDPYEAKVEELRGLLHELPAGGALAAGGSGGVRVDVIRDGAMRTQLGGEDSEGAASCKNALLCARKVGRDRGPLPLEEQEVLDAPPSPREEHLDELPAVGLPADKAFARDSTMDTLPRSSMSMLEGLAAIWGCAAARKPTPNMEIQRDPQ